MTMPPSVRREWAKEIVLEALDAALSDKASIDWDLDEHDAILRERNRVAKLFGLPIRQQHYSIT